jgi:hypothetical protein
MVGPPSSKSNIDSLEGFMSDSSENTQSGAGCLLRTYWMFVGNVLLLLLAVLIHEKKAPLFAFIDLPFWLVVGSILAARYVDIRFMNGETGEGKPATMTNWRRYAVLLLIAAGLVWVLAHLLVARGS